MHSAKGNVLFMILIGIALFAALSFAVTQGGRGNASIDREKLLVDMTDMLQYINQVREGVTYLKVVNRCSNNQISFAYDSNGDGSITSADLYWNATAGTDRRCYVHDPAGANLPRPPVYAGLNDATPLVFSGGNIVEGLGTNVQDLIAILPNTSLAACNLLNQKFKARTNGDGSPREEGSNFVTSRFNGTYSGNIGIDGMLGAPSGCFNGTTVNGTAVGDTYYFYSTLIVR